MRFRAARPCSPVEHRPAAWHRRNRSARPHFGTRDGLLREILEQARQRQLQAFTDLISLRPDDPRPRLARDLRAATTDWLAPLEAGMRSLGRPELATVVLAVIRGLLMDLDATGDAARAGQAFDDFLTTIGDA